MQLVGIVQGRMRYIPAMQDDVRKREMQIIPQKCHRVKEQRKVDVLKNNIFHYII